MNFSDLIIERVKSAKDLDELAATLVHILNEITVDEKGEIILERRQVCRLGNLRIDIYPKEHPPPNFHVISPDLTASFSILNGTLLAGKLNPPDERRIGLWYKGGRDLLIKIWNETRPSNCPVGAIPLP